MARRVVLTVGTKRGLFLLESGVGRKRWKVTGPLLKGWGVPYAVLDTRGTPRLHAGASHYAFGATTMSATLKSLKFKPAKTPPAFPKMNKKADDFAKKYGIDRAPKVWTMPISCDEDTQKAGYRNRPKKSKAGSRTASSKHRRAASTTCGSTPSTRLSIGSKQAKPIKHGQRAS